MIERKKRKEGGDMHKRKGERGTEGMRQQKEQITVKAIRL